jgi:hypothetical protein
MKKIILICGLIAGFISSAWALFYISISDTHANMEYGMIYGYTAMIIGFSFIFVGVKNYRDKHSNGLISFGKAFKIGFFITLIASTVYVVAWLIDYFYFIPDFMDNYAEHILKGMKKDGATQLQLDAKMAEMKDFKEMYQNPLFNAMITYTEIMPPGLIISLISAAILKKNAKSEGQ